MWRLLLQCDHFYLVLLCCHTVALYGCAFNCIIPFLQCFVIALESNVDCVTSMTSVTYYVQQHITYQHINEKFNYDSLMTCMTV